MKLPNLFAPQTSPVPFAAGDTIFDAGQPGDTMYLVQAGEVELRLEGRTLETVGPDGWFGEMALIEGGVRSADAVARTDCTLVPVNERQFLFMVGETPFFALQLLRTLSQRLRRADAAALVLVVLLAVLWMTAAPDAGAQTLTVDPGTSPDTVTTSQTYTTVYDGYTGVGEIDQSGGMFTVNGSNTSQGLFIAYNVNSNGTYSLSGTGSLISNYSADVGTFGTALFNQSGGSAAFNAVGLYVGHYNGSNGTYNQTGGSVTVTGLNFGYFAGATGAYTLDAGGTLSTGTSNVGFSGTGTFTQNGGTWTTNGNPIQVGYNSGSTGTLNLNGGTVTAGTVVGGSGTSTLNLNGGTLQAAASTTNFVGGFTTANVRAGGAIIDSNSFNVTVPQVLGHDSALGTTADGGLSKVGAGTLTLTAANTYTGQTSVTAGTLALPSGGSIGVSGGQANLFVAGTAANAPTLVVSGGSVTAGVVRLGNNPSEVGTITQSAGTVTINGSNGSGQGLFVGYNSSDTGLYTLTGGSLVLNTQSVVGEFGNGTLNQSGGSVAVNGNGLFLGLYNGGSGTYNLSGTGSLSGTTVIVGGDQGSGTGFLHQTGGTINLNGLQIGQNSHGSGAMGTYTLDAGTATVGTVSVGLNTGSTGTVNLNGGTLTAGSVVGQAGTSTFRFNGGTLQPSASNASFFSGFTHAYVGTGGALINTNNFNVTVASALSPDPANGTTTDGGLTKSGTGILTLSVANTFTGTTAVSAGTLAISANGGLGKGSVTLAANATLTLAAGVTAAHNASTGTTLTLAATSTINLAATTAGTVQDTYGAIVIAGVSQLLPGTYGSATSGAVHVFPEFTGNGDVLLTPVPEPGTWALLGVGGGALLGAGRRCRRSRGGRQT